MYKGWETHFDKKILKVLFFTINFFMFSFPFFCSSFYYSYYIQYRKRLQKKDTIFIHVRPLVIIMQHKSHIIKETQHNAPKSFSLRFTFDSLFLKRNKKFKNLKIFPSHFVCVTATTSTTYIQWLMLPCE